MSETGAVLPGSAASAGSRAVLAGPPPARPLGVALRPARALAGRVRRGVLPAAGLLAALALWTAFTGPWSPPLARAFAPDRAATALARLVLSGTIEPHIAGSLARIVVGVGLAFVAGVPTGILIARSRAAEGATNAVFPLLRMISPLTWMPIAVMTFGIGDPPVVFLVAVAAVWPVLLSTAHGVASVDPRWVAAAWTLGAGQRELVRRVLVPAALPDVLTGLRLALGVAWIVLVPAEMLGVRSGLGYFILDTRDRFAYDELAALVIVIGAIGYALDAAVRTLQRRLSWNAPDDRR